MRPHRIDTTMGDGRMTGFGQLSRFRVRARFHAQVWGQLCLLFFRLILSSCVRNVSQHDHGFNLPRTIKPIVSVQVSDSS